ncbi:MAG: hypothetical protein JF609_08115 [Verrucomicrobia bacterium]|nr:hypothetical protein [Verrucomicrobiota bacterium]
MNPEEVQRDFEEALKKTEQLREKFSNAAQDLGRIQVMLGATKPYLVGLVRELTASSVDSPIVLSGVATVNAIKHSLTDIESCATFPIEKVSWLSASAFSFGANTVATSSLISLEHPGSFKVETIPIRDFHAENRVAARLAKIDPALGKTCAEIWETLYGTTADSERAAMFMIRQVWDHLFDKLAPEDEVRASRFWKKKEGDKPYQVFRCERIQFAVDRHIANPAHKEQLLAVSRQMLDFYQEFNDAHTRGEINKEKARSALNAVFSWFIQWADCMGI